MDNKLGKFTEALEHLHKKFPDADQDVFDNLDAVADSILIDNIIEAKIADEACSGCDGTHCRLPERMWRGYYVIALDERTPTKLRLNSTVGRNCKYDPLRGKFGEMFRKSGLVKRQVFQTFENFENVNQEVTMAKIQTKKAAVEHSNIILAGRAGVGKTHLAVATVIYAMREERRQARFRLVNKMLDDIGKEKTTIWITDTGMNCKLWLRQIH